LAISGDYAHPVYVNGYACNNCTQVDEAKKGIDPAHPQSGPYGVNAKSDPTADRSPAVTYGGSLSGLNGAPAAAGQINSSQVPSSQAGVGVRIDTYA